MATDFESTGAPRHAAGSINVSAAMGGSASELFVFRNPFLFPLRLQVSPSPPTSHHTHTSPTRTLAPRVCPAGSLGRLRLYKGTACLSASSSPARAARSAQLLARRCDAQVELSASGSKTDINDGISLLLAASHVDVPAESNLEVPCALRLTPTPPLPHPPTPPAHPNPPLPSRPPSSPLYPAICTGPGADMLPASLE
jgi:hypothetical protein